MGISGGEPTIQRDLEDYEFRTTVVKELLSEENLLQIGGLIKGAKRYYLQRFNPRKTLDPAFLYRIWVISAL